MPIENELVQNKTYSVNYTYYGLSNGLDTLRENLYQHYGQVNI